MHNGLRLPPRKTTPEVPAYKNILLAGMSCFGRIESRSLMQQLLIFDLAVLIPSLHKGNYLKTSGACQGKKFEKSPDLEKI